MDRGLAPCESLLANKSLVPARYYDASWEVGRLVLAPEYRSGPDALKRCLYLTLLHLVQTTCIDNLFAACTPLLSRLYRRFGFTLLIKETLESGTEPMCLIHGHVPSVLMALANTDTEKSQARREMLRMAA